MGKGFNNRGKKKKRRGVKKGYKHHWFYKYANWHETKVGKGLWRVTFLATKGRHRKAKYHKNAPPRGSKVVWWVQGVQKAVKIDKNRYKTKFTGIKRLIDFKRPR